MKNKLLILACLIIPLSGYCLNHNNLYQKPNGVKTRWSSFENPTAEKGIGGMENNGAKGHAFDSIKPGETKTLLNVKGSGTIRRMWMTLKPIDKKMLRSLKLEMFWDGEDKPAVSVPLGDFFGVSVGVMVPFENSLFSSPEGKSLVSIVPMPFKKGAKITIKNESDRLLEYLFYDVNLTQGDKHDNETLYFHASWRRERWTTLEKDFEILPKINGEGRFLGCNIGVNVKPGHEGWWGEGEIKMYIDGDSKYPTLVGTGLEDYIGAAWGLGQYVNLYQGSTVCNHKALYYSFYRYHIPDPVYFDENCKVTIQQIGGGGKVRVMSMFTNENVNIKPITVDKGAKGFIKLLELETVPKITDKDFPEGWVNYYREDDYSATALFYLKSPTNKLPPLAPLEKRIEGIK